MRPRRVDFPGARHHVYNRSRHGMPIFETQADCALFLGLLSLLPEKFGVRVHGYAIMSNHYHLMLESNGNLSKAMQWLMSVFGRRYNARLPGWDGSLWRGRFQSRLAETDRDWANLLAYLHLNPVRSGCVEHAEDAVWTSCRAYMTSNPPTWLTTSPLLDACGGALCLSESTRMAYQRYLATESPKVARRNRIRRLRKQGWTFGQIATALKRSTSTIHRWLHGSTREIFDAWGRRRSPRDQPATTPRTAWATG